MNRVGFQIVCICIFFGAVLAVGMEVPIAGPSSVRGAKKVAKAGEPRAMRREGERLSAYGKIEQTGDRYTFYPADDGPPMRILENLGLERVARVLNTSARNVEPSWNISGVVYVFRGSNFLLMERAILKGRSH
jgi:hypothetical protein